MKKLIFLIAIIVISNLSLRAQVAVSSDGSSADPSAMLEVKSTDKGFLPPRMTKLEKLDIVNPANGLVVYDTDLESLYLFNGTDWEPLVTGSGSKWEQTGNNIFRHTGNVGIGTNNPAALLHTEGTGTGGGNVLFKGEFKTTPGPVPVTGAGTRMMWYPDKAAFRAGRITGTQWDTENIGKNSFATGQNTIASGEFSTAFGNFTNASSSQSTAMGVSTTASGQNSTAMGSSTVASGTNSTAMGGTTTASGDFSTSFGSVTEASGLVSSSMGFSTIASGDYSIAMGFNTEASGNRSTAIGFSTNASGDNSLSTGNGTNATGISSTALGNITTASGDISTTMGRGTTALSFVETAIGSFNTAYTPVSVNSFNSNDRLFVIGNGTSPTSLSDAMVVMKNGDIGIGTSSPEEILEVENSGDVRIRVTSTNNATAAIDLVRSSTSNTDWRIQNDGNLKLFSGSNIDASVTEEYSFGTGIFRPSADNSKQLGSSGNRWISVHAVNGTIQTSDRRFKKDIESLNYGLDQVNQLQPVSYRWIDGNDKATHLGLIAQEVQKIIPEAVDCSNPERLGLNYSELVPVLIQAVRELSAKVDRLQVQTTEQAGVIQQLSGTTASISGK